MIKYAKIKGYNNLGEVGMIGTHLYQWRAEESNKKGLKSIIIVRAYDVDKPMIFKGIIYGRLLKYYPEEILEDLSELEKLVGKLQLVDLKEISDVLSQFKLIKKDI